MSIIELDVAKKVIKQYESNHSAFVIKSMEAERYYKKQNDILYQKKKNDEIENPMRSADNRIASNFYKMQVNQKAAYAFTTPPQFDVGDEYKNDLINMCLGDSFAKKCKALSVQASNKSVAWLHYWKDDKGNFRYAVVDSSQIVPIWTKNLEKELLAVLRIYTELDTTSGYDYVIFEYWTDSECQAFRKRIDLTIDSLECYPVYTIRDVDSGNVELTNTFTHDFGEVPFIFFNNNDEMESDLSDVKQLIDSYDKVYSGFINDLEDIQEIIFIITNYSGDSDVTEVLKEMKAKKVIQVESEGTDDRSGISTLAIDIPVDAREKILSITRKSIFEQGMAIDPDPQNFGNSSGVALSYLYSLLELKTGMMEVEFTISFNHLIRAIMTFYKMTTDKIIQTWKRTSVTNDAELADIAQKSKGIISDDTIIRNHPWVNNPEEELERMKKQKEESMPEWDVVPQNGSGDVGVEE